MGDRHSRKHESSRRRKAESSGRKDETHGTRTRSSRHLDDAAELSSSSDSSYSYVDVSRTLLPERLRGLGFFRAFFSAPSEHRRRPRRRKSRRFLRFGNNSSSSSINSDLAYGTGFVRVPKTDKPPIARREKNGSGRRDRKEEVDEDAAILSMGAELADLARKQSRQDLAEASRLRAHPAKGTDFGRMKGLQPNVGVRSSKISHEKYEENEDEDDWESDTDDDSDISSVDSKLAYGQENYAGWRFGWGSRPPLPEKKSNVVDPGPVNSVRGVIDQPVGFKDVYSDPAGFVPPTARQDIDDSDRAPPLKHVCSIPTTDPGRFDPAGSLVVSEPWEPSSSRSGPVPIQAPRPIAPVSQSFYNDSYSAGPDITLPKVETPGNKKSVAGAALAGVTSTSVGATAGLDRKESRKDNGKRYDAYEDGRTSDPRKGDRRERRRTEVDAMNDGREKRQERRRDNRDYVDDKEKHGDKGREAVRDLERSSRRERYCEELTEDTRDDTLNKGRSDEKNSKYNFNDKGDRETRQEPSHPDPHPEIQEIQRARSPAIVTVERVPHFARKQDTVIKETVIKDQDVQRHSDKKREKVHENRDEDRDEKRTGEEATVIGKETEHFTPPIKSGAISTADEYRRYPKGIKYRRNRSEDRAEEPEDKIEEGTSSPCEDDPILAEADRVYRETVLARKIAQIEDDDTAPRIITPPEKETKIKPNLYDAPNADFQLDHVMDPVEFMQFSPVKELGSSPMIENTDYQLITYGAINGKRPLLNLVRPTPTPSPAPEKQYSKVDSVKPSQEMASNKTAEPRDKSAEVSSEEVKSKEEIVQTSTPTTSPKTVTWSDNETKHYEVESFSEAKNEANSNVKDHEVRSKEPHPTTSKKASPWAAIRDSFAAATAAGAAAAIAEGSKAEEITKSDMKETRPESSRRSEVVGEPEYPDRAMDNGEQNPPSVGVKPVRAPSSQMPGAFDDNIDFIANVAAGLEASGFDSNIVVTDPKFCQRSSPSEPEDPPESMYRKPYAETVSDLGHYSEVVQKTGESESVGKRTTNESPESSIKTYDIKTGNVTEPPSSLNKERDKDTKYSTSQNQDRESVNDTFITAQLVEEPESYVEVSKPTEKDKKRGRSKQSEIESSGIDGNENIPKTSAVTGGSDNWYADESPAQAPIEEWPTSRSKRKSKRDSKQLDSSSRSMSVSEISSEGSGKKLKNKSRNKGAQHYIDADPDDVPTPPAAASEFDENDEFEYHSSRKATRDVPISEMTDADPRSMKSENSSRYDDDDDDLKSDKTSDRKGEKTKSKEKNKGKRKGSLFGLFDFSSKSEYDKSKEEVRQPPKEVEEPKKKSRSSKRSSTADSSEVQGIDKTSSNGNAHRHDDIEILNNREEKHGAVSQPNSFLDDAGTLGAGVGFNVAAYDSQHQQSKAIYAGSVESFFDKSTLYVDSDFQPLESSEGTIDQKFIDPEIKQHQFRPSIDPEYRDLLPLPPSYPGSPIESPIESPTDLPSLPESRPDTPPKKEAILSYERPTIVTRRNEHQVVSKMQSPSAVPIKFKLGNRPSPSPASPQSMHFSSAGISPETTTSPRPRPRPTSWENSREMQPLYLLERKRSIYSVQTGDSEKQGSSCLHAPDTIPKMQEIKGETHQRPSPILAAAIAGASYVLVAPALDSHGTCDEGKVVPTNEWSMRDVEELPQPAPVEAITKDRSSFLFHTPPSAKRTAVLDTISQTEASQRESGLISPTAGRSPLSDDMFGVSLKGLDYSASDSHEAALDTTHGLQTGGAILAKNNEQGVEEVASDTIMKGRKDDFISKEDSPISGRCHDKEYESDGEHKEVVLEPPYTVFKEEGNDTRFANAKEEFVVSDAFRGVSALLTLERPTTVDKAAIPTEATVSTEVIIPDIVTKGSEFPSESPIHAESTIYEDPIIHTEQVADHEKRHLFVETIAPTKTYSEEPPLRAGPLISEEATVPAEKTAAEVSPAETVPMTRTEQTISENPITLAEQTFSEKPITPAEQTICEEPTVLAEKPAAEVSLAQIVSKEPAELTISDRPVTSAEQPFPEEPIASVEQTISEELIASTDQTVFEEPNVLAEKTTAEVPPAQTFSKEPIISEGFTISAEPIASVEQTVSEEPPISSEQSSSEEFVTYEESNVPEEHISLAERTVSEEPAAPVEQTASEEPTVSTEQTALEEPFTSVQPILPEEPIVSAEQTACQEPTVGVEPVVCEKTTVAQNETALEGRVICAESFVPEGPIELAVSEESTIRTKPTILKEPLVSAESNLSGAPTVPAQIASEESGTHAERTIFKDPISFAEPLFIFEQPAVSLGQTIFEELTARAERTTPGPLASDEPTVFEPTVPTEQSVPKEPDICAVKTIFEESSTPTEPIEPTVSEGSVVELPIAEQPVTDGESNVPEGLAGLTEPTFPERPIIPRELTADEEPATREEPTAPQEFLPPEESTVSEEPVCPETAVADESVTGAELTVPEESTGLTKATASEQPTHLVKQTATEEPAIPAESTVSEEFTPEVPTVSEESVVPLELPIAEAEASATDGESNALEGLADLTEPTFPEPPAIPTEQAAFEETGTPAESTVSEESIPPEELTVSEEPVPPELGTAEESVTDGESTASEQPTHLAEQTATEEPALPAESTVAEESIPPEELTVFEEPVVPLELLIAEESVIGGELNVHKETTGLTEPTASEQPTQLSEQPAAEEQATPAESTVAEEQATPAEPTVAEEQATPAESTVAEEQATPAEPTVAEEQATPAESTVAEESISPEELTVSDEPVIPPEFPIAEESVTDGESNVPEGLADLTEPTFPEQPIIPTEQAAFEETATPEESTVSEESIHPEELTVSEEPVPLELPIAEESVVGGELNVPKEDTSFTEPTASEQPTQLSEQPAAEEQATPAESNVVEESISPEELTVSDEPVIPPELPIAEESGTDGESNVPEGLADLTEPTFPEQPIIPTEQAAFEEPVTRAESTVPENFITSEKPTDSEEPVVPLQLPIAEESVTGGESNIPEEPTGRTEPTVSEQATLPAEQILSKEPDICAEQTVSEEFEEPISPETSAAEESVTGAEFNVLEELIPPEISADEEPVTDAELNVLEESIPPEIAAAEESVTGAELNGQPIPPETAAAAEESVAGVELNVPEESIPSEIAAAEESVTGAELNVQPFSPEIAAAAEETATSAELTALKEPTGLTEPIISEQPIVPTEQTASVESDTRSESTAPEEFITLGEPVISKKPAVPPELTSAEESVTGGEPNVLEEPTGLTEPSVSGKPIVPKEQTAYEEPAILAESTVPEESITREEPTVSEEPIYPEITAVKESVTGAESNVPKEPTHPTGLTVSDEPAVRAEQIVREESPTCAKSTASEEPDFRVMQTISEEPTAPVELIFSEEHTERTAPGESATRMESIISESVPAERTHDKEAAFREEPTVSEEYIESILTGEPIVSSEPVVTEKPATCAGSTVSGDSIAPAELTASEEPTIPAEQTVAEESATSAESTISEELIAPAEPTIFEERTVPAQQTVFEESASHAKQTALEDPITIEPNIVEESIVTSEQITSQDPTLGVELAITEDPAVAEDQTALGELAIYAQPAVSEEFIESAVIERPTVPSERRVSEEYDTRAESTASEEPAVLAQQIASKESAVSDMSITPTEPTVFKESTVPAEQAALEEPATSVESIVSEEITIPAEQTGAEGSATHVEPNICEEPIVSIESTVSEELTIPTEQIASEELPTRPEQTVSEETIAIAEPTFSGESIAPAEYTVSEGPTTPAEQTVPEDPVSRAKSIDFEEPNVSIESTVLEELTFPAEQIASEESATRPEQINSEEPVTSAEPPFCEESIAPPERIVSPGPTIPGEETITEDSVTRGKSIDLEEHIDPTEPTHSEELTVPAEQTVSEESATRPEQIKSEEPVASAEPAFPEESIASPEHIISEGPTIPSEQTVVENPAISGEQTLTGGPFASAEQTAFEEPLDEVASEKSISHVELSISDGRIIHEDQIAYEEPISSATINEELATSAEPSVLEEHTNSENQITYEEPNIPSEQAISKESFFEKSAGSEAVVGDGIITKSTVTIGPDLPVLLEPNVATEPAEPTVFVEPPTRVEHFITHESSVLAEPSGPNTAEESNTHVMSDISEEATIPVEPTFPAESVVPSASNFPEDSHVFKVSSIHEELPIPPKSDILTKAPVLPGSYVLDVSNTPTDPDISAESSFLAEPVAHVEPYVLREPQVSPGFDVPILPAVPVETVAPSKSLVLSEPVPTISDVSSEPDAEPDTLASPDIPAEPNVSMEPAESVISEVLPISASENVICTEATMFSELITVPGGDVISAEGPPAREGATASAEAAAHREATSHEEVTHFEEAAAPDKIEAPEEATASEEITAHEMPIITEKIAIPDEITTTGDVTALGSYEGSNDMRALTPVLAEPGPAASIMHSEPSIFEEASAPVVVSAIGFKETAASGTSTVPVEIAQVKEVMAPKAHTASELTAAEVLITPEEIGVPDAPTALEKVTASKIITVSETVTAPDGPKAFEVLASTDKLPVSEGPIAPSEKIKAVESAPGPVTEPTTPTEIAIPPESLISTEPSVLIKPVISVKPPVPEEAAKYVDPTISENYSIPGVVSNSEVINSQDSIVSMAPIAFEEPKAFEKVTAPVSEESSIPAEPNLPGKSTIFEETSFPGMVSKLEIIDSTEDFETAAVSAEITGPEDSVLEYVTTSVPRESSVLTESTVPNEPSVFEDVSVRETVPGPEIICSDPMTFEIAAVPVGIAASDNSTTTHITPADLPELAIPMELAASADPTLTAEPTIAEVSTTKEVSSPERAIGFEETTVSEAMVPEKKIAPEKLATPILAESALATEPAVLDEPTVPDDEPTVYDEPTVADEPTVLGESSVPDEPTVSDESLSDEASIPRVVLESREAMTTESATVLKEITAPENFETPKVLTVPELATTATKSSTSEKAISSIPVEPTDSVISTILGEPTIGKEGSIPLLFSVSENTINAGESVVAKEESMMSAEISAPVTTESPNLKKTMLITQGHSMMEPGPSDMETSTELLNAEDETKNSLFTTTRRQVPSTEHITHRKESRKGKKKNRKSSQSWDIDTPSVSDAIQKEKLQSTDPESSGTIPSHDDFHTEPNNPTLSSQKYKKKKEGKSTEPEKPIHSNPTPGQQLWDSELDIYAESKQLSILQQYSSTSQDSSSKENKRIKKNKKKNISAFGSEDSASSASQEQTASKHVVPDLHTGDNQKPADAEVQPTVAIPKSLAVETAGNDDIEPLVREIETSPIVQSPLESPSIGGDVVKAEGSDTKEKETRKPTQEAVEPAIIHYLTAALPSIMEKKVQEIDVTCLKPEQKSPKQVTDDVNRDSAFVSESPALIQRKPEEDPEYSRDSGVHLREWGDIQVKEGTDLSSPPVACLTWPAVDEGTKVVDLNQSKDSKPEQSPKHGPHDVAIGAAAVGGGLLALHATLTNKNEVRETAPRERSITPINRLQTPEQVKYRPGSVGSNRSSHSATPPLRRSEKHSDLRSPSQRSQPSLAKEAEKAKPSSIVSAAPVANEGRVRTKDMATDVYDGFGVGLISSPISPTRPLSRRHSMQLRELEEIIKSQREEISKLKEVNEGLKSDNITSGHQQNERYKALEARHVQASINVENKQQEKDQEILQLRQELEASQLQITQLQRQILESKRSEDGALVLKDEDYFDNACQQLCQYVQQWVLRFSKFSDMRACRLTREINNDKIIDRLDNAVLDGSDVDIYLSDRVKRRDVFMSMTMTMIWEFVFTRYLFGMERDQRQKLKILEKTLAEVGPQMAVHHWRATTLTLLSKRPAFLRQREQDTEAVVQMIFQTLSEILPPPTNLEEQIQEQLRRVLRAAVDLSIEMRIQRAEYMMLPPLQPEYDANGDLARQVQFNASLMNERSGDTVSNEELEAQQAVVRIVLFPLVVKKGDDRGDGDEEIVVCPAQVLVAKPKKAAPVFNPVGHGINQSKISMQSSMPPEHVGGGL